jgi:hypothetical protein
MYRDVEDQFDSEKLNKDYCYYVILVHCDHHSFTTPESNQLILVDVVDKTTMNSLLLDSDEFSHFEHRQSSSSRDREELTTALFQEPTHYGPVIANSFGITLHTNDGQIRIVDRNCQHATDVLPNLPDPHEHWIALLNKEPLDQLPATLPEFMDYLESGKKMQEYLLHYPNQQALFQTTRSIFLDTVSDIMADYDDIFSNPRWPFINGRRFKFTKEVVKEFDQGEMTDVELAYYLTGEDTKRVHFIMNPYDIAPREHQPYRNTNTNVSSSVNDTGLKTITRRNAVSDMGKIINNNLVL